MIKYNVYRGVKKIKTKTMAVVSGTAVGVSALAMAIAMPLAAHAAVSTNYTLFGDASIVQPGNGSANAVEATTTGTPAYGGVSYTDVVGSTVGQLQTLSTEYEFTTGSCGAGSPRFSVGVTDGTHSGNIFVYLGPAPNYTLCAPNVWANTGNLADPTNLVDTSQLPGGTFYQPYAAAQTAYGSYTITDLSLVMDGSNQAARFDNTIVNSNTYTYEPSSVPTKDTCKNNGWKSMHDTSSHGFKNQGDCVSFFATGGKNLGNGQ